MFNYFVIKMFNTPFTVKIQRNGWFLILFLILVMLVVRPFWPGTTSLVQMYSL